MLHNQDALLRHLPIGKDLSPCIGQLVSLDQNYYQIVKEGMRLGVTEGTSQALNVPFVKVGSKTGTAQLGLSKDQVNSWVVGFWPYDNPKYAYAVVMERGSKNNQFGAVLVIRGLLDWMKLPLYITENMNLEGLNGLGNTIRGNNSHSIRWASFG